ncbi:MAG: Gfo/Idh/MocA family oxidoreductase [Anaerocolumna aminovalerica]|jgi:predicted dehydrogenase|uniref:Gfo/Idh/MocA family protein n=1 Tax=Anaerocolumna aminovalerica TaxID=1527 RepID=UPI00248B9550|nr:Gfo/Idh/MocA family oxidoreductase [Anaerocolumna aminovalerica]MDU6263444.1 Gfo/Idh/MocA family oxidoreductase [Anaerocolumna aminovalerica]
MKVIILGAGGRGRNYTRFCRQYGAEIVGIADPDTKKLEKLAMDFNISEDKLFHDWAEIMAKEKFADAVINATPDKVHYVSTMEALEKGYHVLLEKPMSDNEQECINMVEKAEKKNVILMVCHVLRYAPFFEKLKEIIDEERIGQLVNIEMTENCAYWHFVHSYVRGVFRNETISSPFILAKSCHDLDLIGYLTGKKCLSVVSEGNLKYYRKENAPEGAPDYCLDGCPHETTCPYFAPRLYLKQISLVGWPTQTISADTSFAARYEALKNGQYGRCVFHCDNDVCDHQTAIFNMEDGLIASFNMTGFSSENTRTLRFYGTKGDIRGHLERGELEVFDFLTKEKEVIKIQYETIQSGHGGGDLRLLYDFLDGVDKKGTNLKTLARLSLQSHLMAFAAERSRKEGKRIYL